MAYFPPVSETPKDFGVPGAPETEKVMPVVPLMGVPTVPLTVNTVLTPPLADPPAETTVNVVAPAKAL